MQKAVLSQDAEKVNQRTRNQLDHILYSDVLDIFRIIGNYLPNLSSSVQIVLLLFVFSLFVDHILSFFLLSANIFSIIISCFSRKKIHELSSAANVKIKQLHRHLNAFARSIDKIKADNLADYYEAETASDVSSFIASSINEDKSIYFL